MQHSCGIILAASLALSGTLRAEDAELAAAIAASAAKLGSQGLREKAKSLCFKALANDPNCPEALYELGKLFQLEGKPVVAGEFLVRAVRMLEKAKTNPELAVKLQDAQTRLKSLSPCAVRLARCLEDYCQELDGVVKQASDPVTQDEIHQRLTRLRLAEFVPPERIPKVEPLPGSSPPGGGTASGGGERKDPGEGAKRPPTAAGGPKKGPPSTVPVEVEKALKAKGWTKIAGTWTKKKEDVYEVTDGRLEAQKTNGALSVLVHTGGTGKVSAFVRNGGSQKINGSLYGGSIDTASGYGARIGSSNCSIYAPVGISHFIIGTAEGFIPVKDHDIPLVPGSPKNQILVQLQETKLEIYFNGKRERQTKYQLTENGPFAIIIEGTMTIESPQVMGQ